MFKNFPLNNLTTVRTGGKAKALIKVSTVEELINSLNAIPDKFLIVGGGSNLIFPDSEYDGIIIKNEINGIKISAKIVTVQSGTSLQDLVNTTIDYGLAGLEKLTGIPGTVGGAVYGNAGAYGQTISDHLFSVKVLRNGKIVNIPKSKCFFKYRQSIFKQTKDPIIEVTFKLISSNSQTLKKEADEIFNLRLERYPTGIKCPGSFFMNVPLENVPPTSLSLIPKDKIRNGNVHVGYLLESIGAKGLRVGDVEVASYHGNLLINKSHGTSSDFYKLAKKLAKKVKEKYGIILTPEVQLIEMPEII